MRWLKSWPCWILIIVCCATFLLPEIPFYQDWMPYGYELGGMALVILYLAFGFGSLGLYGLVIGGSNWITASLKRPCAFKIGIGALALATGLMWCYLKLMDLTLNL